MNRPAKPLSERRKIEFTAEWNGKVYHVTTADQPLSYRGACRFRGFRFSGRYIHRLVRNHPLAMKDRYHPEHRLIMEKQLGRFLLPEEVVHHINGDGMDNRIENLRLISNSREHAGEHTRGKRNPNGQFVASDPAMQEIKIRLYDKNKRIVTIYPLGKLISTTFTASRFIFRGRDTGFQDTQGLYVYQGDLIELSSGRIQEVKLENGIFMLGSLSLLDLIKSKDPNTINGRIVGNVWDKEAIKNG